MSSKRRKFVVIISIISAFSILFGTVVAAAAWSEGGISELWNSLTNKDGVVKYEKPSVGEIAQDGAYPNEVKSNSSANAQEKEWYEYITYSKTPIGEVQDGNTKYVFYDPYDYNYGMIMKTSNPENDFGDYYDGEEGYTTANEISVSYSKSKSTSWSKGWSFELGFGEEITVDTFVADTKVKFSRNLGWSDGSSGSNDSSVSKDITYNALYFDADGTPYCWRIVKYTVYLPLYCEAQRLVNGEWVVIENNYCLIATVQGTCREWINKVAYIEDWRTGEHIQVENFWKEFFTEDALIAAYEEEMIPIN